MRRPLTALALVLAGSTLSVAHDIPNARVDRSIQASLDPGRLRVDYEVSLSELTLTQDLRQLIGELPGADRQGWFQEYGRVTGPLNAKGFLVAVDGNEVELKSTGFDLVVEGHPRYTFHIEAEVPLQGRLTLNDTNYVASEGTSRLALRPADGVTVRGDALPTDVNQIPIRPVWQLSDPEERRTRRLTVEFLSKTNLEPVTIVPTTRPSAQARPSPTTDGLSRLLDDVGSRAWPALLIAAFLLGAVHAIQPGHGKTIVAASSLEAGGGPFRGALLGLLTAMAHMGSVALIAFALWATRAVRPADVHLALARSAGFVIAAIGLWRLGRHLAGFSERIAEHSHPTSGAQSLIPLALAGGIVPCWDAVVLVILAEAIGRLTLGLALLAAFSLGMAAVLVAIGVAASRFRQAFARSESRGKWERRLGIGGGIVLSLIGVLLMRSG
jgi:nickel/cobalt transporter (NicO) family protein